MAANQYARRGHPHDGEKRASRTIRCALSLSSEPHLRFGLCRQRRERSRSAWRSRAHKPSVERVVAQRSQKNWADIGVPNPRENSICRCNLYRLRSGLISVARRLRRVGHTVPKRSLLPKRSLPERNRLYGVRSGAIARMIDGKQLNASKQKHRYGLPSARRRPDWRQGQGRCRETSGRPHTLYTSWHAYSFTTRTHTRPGLPRPPRHN